MTLQSGDNVISSHMGTVAVFQPLRLLAWSAEMDACYCEMCYYLAQNGDTAKRAPCGYERRRN